MTLGVVERALGWNEKIQSLVLGLLLTPCVDTDAALSYLGRQVPRLLSAEDWLVSKTPSQPQIQGQKCQFSMQGFSGGHFLLNFKTRCFAILDLEEELGKGGNFIPTHYNPAPDPFFLSPWPWIARELSPNRGQSGGSNPVAP